MPSVATQSQCNPLDLQEHEPITELPKSASTTSQLKSELGDDAEVCI